MPRVPSDIFEVVKREEAVPSVSHLEIKLVTGLSAVVIDAEPGISYAVAKGVLSHSPAAPRDTDLDIYFDCEGYDINGNPRRGVGIVLALAYGSVPFIDFTATAVATAYAYGDYNEGSIYSGIAISLALAYGDLLLEGTKSNWIKWSKIGTADFTIWKDNVAGEKPVDWKGSIYAIKKLLNKMVVYGENGVSYLLPVEKYFDTLTIHRLGLKGRDAVAGDEKVHYFVDTAGQLWELGEVKEVLVSGGSLRSEKILLDYSEYLTSMGSNIVLSWDAQNSLLYICDGTLGYVYSPISGSLGKGPVNVTGVSSQDKVSYIVSPGTIVIPMFEICTDIYDMGSRKNKTIHSVEVGTDMTYDLWLSMDYRLSELANFISLGWNKVNPNGVANILCFGIEFRFKLKKTTYEYFEIDYIKINGVIHDYSYIDSYTERGT